MDTAFKDDLFYHRRTDPALKSGWELNRTARQPGWGPADSVAYCFGLVAKTRVLFTCPGCDTTWAHDYERISVAGRSRLYRLGQLPIQLIPSTADVRCRQCQCYSRTAVVRGHYSSTRCSVVCTSAKGATCACECGGANHGRGFLRASHAA